MTTNSGEVTPRIAPVRCAVAMAESTPATANAPCVVGAEENTRLIAPVPGVVVMVGSTRQIADARAAADTVDCHLDGHRYHWFQYRATSGTTQEHVRR
jgi:hypothetical protein